MRRSVLAVILCLAAGPLFAADVTQAWVRQLHTDGYAEITVRRTWLGRIRITAEKGEIEREIVLNRASGEVLRDVSRHEDGSVRFPFFDEDDDRDDRDDGEDPEDDEKDEADEKDDDGDDDDKDDGGDEGDDGEDDD